MEQRTIIFVDQVGSTRQLAEIGDVAMVDVRQRLWKIINGAAAAHNGRVFSDEGDGGSQHAWEPRRWQVCGTL